MELHLIFESAQLELVLPGSAVSDWDPGVDPDIMIVNIHTDIIDSVGHVPDALDPTQNRTWT